MIYETQIKLKNYLIEIEFDSETEEFNYIIKERKTANAKKESNKERTDKSNQPGNEPEPNRNDDDFLS